MTLTLEKRTHKPPRILIYGPPKMGKSTFASLAPAPVFIQTEDGLDAIDVPAFPLAQSFGDVLNAIEQLATQEHDRKTVVLDSVDWLERLIFEQLCKERNVKTVADVPYGKGWEISLDLWRQYIDAVDWLRMNKNMMVINIAHSQIKRFNNPETDAYDRYQIKMYEKAADLLMEKSDLILFVNDQVSITKSQEGFNKRVRAIGEGERVLYTESRPSFVAGNRFSLPAEIPFDRSGQYWSTIVSHIPFFNKGE